MDNEYPILVTGSAGLIGQELIGRLRSKNITVSQLDLRLPTTDSGHGKLHDVALLTQKISHCRGIIHLAAVSRVIWAEQDPIQCQQTNVENCKLLLASAAASSKKPWVIFASSREVYGQQNHFPVSEDAILAPINVYGRSKVAGEKLVSFYQQQGLITATLRFSSVYGSAHDHPDRVIPAFCLAALRGEFVRIDGNNLLDFTHVKDVATAIMTAMNLLEINKTSLPTMHLTTGQGTSLLELTQLISNILGKKINHHFSEKRAYGVNSFYGDPTLAKQVLNWQPTIELSEGIADLIQQYRKNPNISLISELTA